MIFEVWVANQSEPSMLSSVFVYTSFVYLLWTKWKL